MRHPNAFGLPFIIYFVIKLRVKRLKQGFYAKKMRKKEKEKKRET